MTEPPLRWVTVATMAEIDALDPDQALGVEAEGTPIAIARHDGQLYAIGDICSHGRAYLSEGFLDGCLLECPLHQGQFDIRTGAPMSTPVTEPVASYPVRVDGHTVLVGLPG